MDPNNHRRAEAPAGDSTSSSSTSNNDENDLHNTHKNASAEAAGIVRGLARSSAGVRTVARLPIGSLPRRAVFMNRRLPVRQVARLSDRISTGLDLYSSAVESTTTTTTTEEGRRGGKKQRLLLIPSRVISFATCKSKRNDTQNELADECAAFQRHTSTDIFVITLTLLTKFYSFRTSTALLKNTLLGTAVFEAYGFTVLKLAPTTEEAFKRRQVEVDDDEGNTQVHMDEADEFARASLTSHFVSGLVAGTVHGVASTFIEGTGASNILRTLPAMTVHHAVAHSLLFGSYESVKRAMLTTFLSDEDDGTQFYGGEYLVSFGVAGGMAGQIQHVASHYTEQLLGITEGCAAAAAGDAGGVVRVAFNPRTFSSLAAPAIRPILFAFPPSAIGFIAFEYGKKFMT
jgi:hypothetical protein